MYANKKEPTVITNTELFGILLLSLLLMVLIFPKQSIEKAISDEKSNYDLTLIYLESIARAYPNNSENWLRLLKAELKMGKTKEAEQILQKMAKMPTVKQIYLDILSFELIRTRYQKSTTKEEKKALFQLLKERLEKFAESNDPTLWQIAIKEAPQLSLDSIAYEAFAKRVSHTTLCSNEELKRFFYLGQKVHKEEKTLKILQNYLAQTPQKEIYELLKNHFLAHQAYNQAAEIESDCYRNLHQPKCLLDAATYFFIAKEDQKSIALLHKYQDNYLDDADISQKIIKLYLAYQKLHEAHEYTLKVLHRQKLLPERRK